MKRSEKQRLSKLTRSAIDQISGDYAEIKSRARKIATKFSPTSAEQCRNLSELAWWLIAIPAYDDAHRVLDALCEIDDDYYWMFDAQASNFATRAYLRSKQKRTKESKLDAKIALEWTQRDPNYRSIKKSEVSKTFKRFDGWLERAESETTIRAIHLLSHAMRVLVMYQQFAKAGDTASKTAVSRDYTTRLNSALKRLKKRLTQLDAG